MDKRIVQVRKKGGLHSIRKGDNRGNIRVEQFGAKSKNRDEEGKYEGPYQGSTIPDTKRFITPTWNARTGQWAWGSTVQKLSELIEKMKLRYPKGYPEEGQLIKAGSDAGERLLNIKDPIFTHPELYTKYFMRDGRISLDTSRPMDEFIYHCMAASPEVEDLSSDKKLNGFLKAGTSYSMVSPKKENQRKKQDAKLNIRASSYLGSMENDVDRMMTIAEVMDLPSWHKGMDSDSVFTLLADNAVNNPQHNDRYGKTYMARFVELAEMKAEDLTVLGNVRKGIKLGIIRRRDGSYVFNGQKLDKVSTEIRLCDFMLDPGNQDYYVKLTEMIEEKQRV